MPGDLCAAAHAGITRSGLAYNDAHKRFGELVTEQEISQPMKDKQCGWAYQGDAATAELEKLFPTPVLPEMPGGEEVSSSE